MNRLWRTIIPGVAAVTMGALAVAGQAAAGPAPAGSAAVPAGSAPVPKGFAANSITWNTRMHGWALGRAPCGATVCTDVISSTDGGTTWQRSGGIAAPVARIGFPEQPGVTEIHFATSAVGYAFAPYLFRTADGGRTWSRMSIPGRGRQVFDLAGNAETTFALVSPCAWANFAPRCRSQLSLWRTAAQGGGTWTRIRLQLPWSTRGDVAVHGNSVYVVDPQADVSGGKDRLYASTDGGRHFTARAVPCDKPATPDVALVQTVPTSATRVALLCVGNPGFSKAQKFVYTSTNAARTDRYAGTMGVYGYQSQLAVSGSGNLAVTSVSDGSFIYINNTHGGTEWTMTWASSDGGVGWNDVQYVTDTEAWVVRGAPSELVNGPGKLYVTHNSGKTWYIHPIH